MKAVIMQPTYLPWVGYFDLMDQADIFVYLDSVQFEKRSWQQRNRMKKLDGEMYLTVPVLSKKRFEQRIKEVEIDPSSKFFDEHLKSVQWNYVKAPYFKDYFPAFSEILQQRHVKLADLNLDLIEWFKNILKIKTRTIRSSLLDVNGNKTALLIAICKALNCDEYLSPPGSRGYIEENNLFREHGISLHYHQYQPVPYAQKFGEFIPYLSVLDLLFNEGPNSLSIIRGGRKENISV